MLPGLEGGPELPGLPDPGLSDLAPPPSPEPGSCVFIGECVFVTVCFLSCRVHAVEAARS